MKKYKSLVILFSLVFLSTVSYAENNETTFDDEAMNAEVKVWKAKMKVLQAENNETALLFDLSIFDEVKKKIVEAEALKAENEALGNMEDIVAENKAATAENKAVTVEGKRIISHIAVK